MTHNDNECPYKENYHKWCHAENLFSQYEGGLNKFLMDYLNGKNFYINFQVVIK